MNIDRYTKTVLTGIAARMLYAKASVAVALAISFRKAAVRSRRRRA